MDQEKAIILFHIRRRNQTFDLEVPLHITANELVIALNAAYSLGIDTSKEEDCYLKAERPIALLRGNRTLADYGIRSGSIIHYTE